MDIRHLKYFKEIVDQGSISKAAETLHIAQPPLSQLLKKLEDELGSTLIRRYREKWELTETGSILYHHATETIFQMRDVKERIGEIEKGAGGTLHLGVSTACSHLVLPYIEVFRARFPDVKLNILTGNSEYLLEKLEQREIETAVLLRPANSEHYSITHLDIPSSVVVVPNGWKKEFEQGRVAFGKLASYPYIMLGSMEGYSFYENITAAFREHNLEPNVVMECKDIHMVVSLIRREMGISILPKMDDAAILFENTAFFELEGYRFGVEPIVISRKGGALSKAAEHFRDISEEMNSDKINSL